MLSAYETAAEQFRMHFPTELGKLKQLTESYVSACPFLGRKSRQAQDAPDSVFSSLMLRDPTPQQEYF